MTEAPTYYAVKILTAHATKGHKDGLLLETEFLKAIKGSKGSHSLLYLVDHFETEGPHGQHLCLVQPVLSTDIARFRRSAPSERLGFSTVKTTIVQVLEALVTLHAARIILVGLLIVSQNHRVRLVDLQPDNVLFCDGTDPESIRRLLNDTRPALSNHSLPILSAGMIPLRSWSCIPFN